MREFHPIEYTKAMEFIHEGDVLLFRGTGIISRLIQRFGRGLYSHVGLASKNGAIIEIVEFREFVGARTVNLQSQLICPIDVYRASPYVEQFLVNYDQDGNPQVSLVRKEFDGKKLTDRMRELTGLNYNWDKIWLLLRQKLPVLRIFEPIEVGDCIEGDRMLTEVCSTALAQTFQDCFIDLIPNLPNSLCDPSMLSRSPILNYIFTIEPTKKGRPA